MADRPAGKGLGECPNPSNLRANMATPCGCREHCAVCGQLKHTGVHMHLLGEKPGNPPYGHEFAPKQEQP